MIFFHAEQTPDKPAIAILGTIVSYEKLAKGIRAIEEKILAAGLKTGETVAISVLNPIGHFAIICALFRLGIASVSIHPSQEPNLDEIVVDALLADKASGSPSLRTIIVEESWFKDPPVSKRSGPPRSYPKRDPEAIARIVLSSGTTGQAKAISLSYRSVQERLISYALRLSTPSWERLVCIPGIVTNFGFCFVITTVWLGRMVCFASDDVARQAVASYRADLLLASTVQVAQLVRLQEANFIPLDSLKSIHIGGSIAFSPLLTKIRLLICAHLYCGYGSTEGGTVAYAHAGPIHGIDRAVGFVAPWIDIEVLDDENKKIENPNREGQIRIRAFGQGYRYKKISETEFEIDRGEWFYPGDIGRVYRNGLLIVLGRINDIINKGGVKISPDIIEQQLASHPDIADAAVVGVLNDIGIEQIWVGIVAREPTEIDVQKIFDYCREKMPLTMPDRIYVVSEIPRNQLGKIVRESLKEKLVKLETATTGAQPWRPA